MSVQLINDIHWINVCENIDEGHIHNSVYLIHGESNILIDTGSSIHKEQIMAEIEDLLEGENLDAILISHSDNPHSANAVDFAKHWGVELHSAVGAPNAQGGFPYGKGNRKIVLGKDFDIGERTFRSKASMLVDRPNSTGIYDYSTGVYFTADGFGNLHSRNECAKLYDDSIVRDNDLKDYYRYKLPWLRFVDSDKITSALREHLSEFDISHIAPIHGNPIPSESIDNYLESFNRAVDEIYENYQSPRSPNPSLPVDSE